ncbi:hypothetical protein LSH36_166g05087 [Paralvinella palmiformis]|uniref:SOCS box domain-containing protein n=1 Tax=Paralvinella palmiformis TaxID=53620 RepID=A0AAD9JT34_9ANNE|nr:hypothetical protein LSH36_166g05087 [Paralvinella palmiformis]
MLPQKYCVQAKAREEMKGRYHSTNKTTGHPQRPHPKCADEDGQTALHLSIIRYCVEEGPFDAAVKAGCDVNKANKMGQTALHLASKKGLSDCVWKLLDCGAAIDLLDKRDMSPLMYAAQNGHPTVIKSLVKKGASVNLSNSKGQLALHYSCLGGYSCCTELLLKYKSKPNYPDNEGTTPLVLASKSNNVQVVQAMLDAGAKPDKVDGMKRSALHWAALSGNQEIVDALISAGASLDLMDKNYATAFMYAIFSDFPGVLQSLVSAGCERSCLDGMNGTALTLASLKGQQACVSVLLCADDDPDEFSYFGMTALMASVYESHLEVSETILQYKPNLNLVSRLGFTALFAAMCHIDDCNAETRHKLLVLLIQNGADVNQPFNCTNAFSNVMKGKNSPLLFAITTGYISLVKILLHAGSEVLPDENEYLKDADKDSRYELSCVLRPLTDYWCKPVSLQHLCRMEIRRNLGFTVQERLQQLPVPSKLKNYLNFSDLADIPPERAKVRQEVNNVMLSMLDLTVCGLQSIEGSFLCRQVRETVIQAAPTGSCSCRMCVRMQELGMSK